MRRVVEHKALDFEPNFVDFASRIQSELKKKLVEFDPSNPDYVIIVPRKFYWDWGKIKHEKLLDTMRVKLPPFLDTRNPVGRFRTIGWTLVGITAASYLALYVVAAASLLAPAAAAGGAVAAGGGTAATGGGGTVISLAAFKALHAAPAVKPLAAAAGVLIVIGNIKDAHAKTVTIGDVSAFRVVPVSDFATKDGVETAYSTEGFKLSDVCRELAGHFDVGTEVAFDGEPYYIIAQLAAK